LNFSVPYLPTAVGGILFVLRSTAQIPLSFTWQKLQPTK